MAISDLEAALDGAVDRINVEGIQQPLGHYRHAAILDNTRPGFTFYISGITGFDEDGSLPEDAYKQSMQALKSISAVIIGAAHEKGITINEGKVLNHILRSTAYVVDINKNYDRVNQAYIDSGVPATARSIVSCNPYQKGILVLIEAIAFIPLDG